jgi:RNA polymerase sigma factor (sigma-70 family)
MPAANGPTIERYLHDLCCHLSLSTDADLLERYRKGSDGRAFAELVRRHGPLVLGACRRALGHTADAEDAFQATFLALARSTSVRPGATIAPWLYRVAVRTAHRARRKRAAFQSADLESVAVERSPLVGLMVAELFRALDEELLRLPEQLRAPLVLCYLDGRARDEAATLLGWSLGTLKRRLEEGRRLLRLRLTRRGLCHATVGQVGLAVAVSGDGLRPAVSEALMTSVSRLAAGGTVPTTVQALVGGPGLGGWAARLAVPILLLAGLSFGVIAASTRSTSKGPTAPESSLALPAKPVGEAPRKDRYGDALPAGALARLGTLRHRAANSAVAVTPDGKTVVTAGNDLVIRAFDAATGDTRATIPITAPPTSSTALAPDARYLAGVACEPAGTSWLGVWSTFNGDRVARRELKEPAAAVSVAPGRERVAYIQGRESFPPSRQQLCIWDFKSAKGPKVLRAFTRKNDPRRFGEPRTCFSADGARLLAHQQDGQFGCWDVATGKQLWERNLPYLKFFFFHPDGAHVVVAPAGSGYEIWKVADGKSIPERAWPGKDHRKAWSYWPVGMSPDGKLLAFFQGQRRVVLWDVQRKAMVATLDDPLRAKDEPIVGFWAVPCSFAFTPDGTGFVWRSSTVQRWQIKTGKPAWPATWDKGHTEAIVNLRFTSDGKSLVSAAHDSAVYVWGLDDAAPKLRLGKGLGGLFAITPDSKTLVIGTGQRRPPLAAWDLATGEARRVLQEASESAQYGSSSDVHAVVSRDGKLVTATDNSIGNTTIPTGRYLTRWDLATGKLLGRERIGTRVETNVLSPDGEFVALFDPNNPNLGVRILATTTGKETMRLVDVLPRMQRAGAFQCDLAVSPQGRLLATRCSPVGRRSGRLNDWGDLQVWDLKTGARLARLALTGPALFCFGADERGLVVATPDALQLFELASRKLIHRIEAPGAALAQRATPFATALTVSPRGRTVATGHSDGTILVWDVRPGTSAVLSRDRLDAAWAMLKGADAAKAYATVWQLVDTPALALAAIKGRLKSAVPVTEAVELVKLLDADDFKTREKATARLRALGSRVEPALRAALKEAASVEVRMRARRLLEPLEAARPLDEDDRCHVRAVQVLELIGNTPARRLLKELAAGDAGARLTRYAREALSRLDGK